MAQRAPTLPALTGLRFLAAALVLLIHFVHPYVPQGFWYDVAMNGSQGVTLFFVLSGFILTYTYSAPSGFRGSTRTYYRARFARIYPVYLLGLLVALPLLVEGSTYSGPHTLPAAVVVASNLTALQGWLPWGGATWNSPAWSLSVEALFYALLPALLPAVVRWRPRALYVALVAASVATQIAPTLYRSLRPDQGAPYQDFPYWLAVLWYNPVVFVPTFLVGVFLARLFLLRQGAPPRSAGPLSLLALVLTLFALSWSYLWLDPIRLHAGLLAPVFGLLIYALAWGRGPLAWLLASRPLQALGNASYAVYLLQFGVWSWLQPAGIALTTLAATLAFLGVLIAASCLVYRWYEQPLRRLVASWPRRDLTHGLAAPTPPSMVATAQSD